MTPVTYGQELFLPRRVPWVTQGVGSGNPSRPQQLCTLQLEPLYPALVPSFGPFGCPAFCLRPTLGLEPSGRPKITQPFLLGPLQGEVLLLARPGLYSGLETPPGNWERLPSFFPPVLLGALSSSSFLLPSPNTTASGWLWNGKPDGIVPPPPPSAPPQRLLKAESRGLLPELGRVKAHIPGTKNHTASENLRNLVLVKARGCGGRVCTDL